MSRLEETNPHLEKQEREWWEKYSRLEEEIMWVHSSEIRELIRESYLREMANYLYQSGGRALDIGCGTGFTSIALARSGMQVKGIDLSETQIAKAREVSVGLSNCSFEAASLDQIVARGKRYDSVILHAILHHLANTEIPVFLAKIKAILKENAKVFIYEPLKADNLTIYGKVIRLFLVGPLAGILLLGVMLRSVDMEMIQLIRHRSNEARRYGWKCSPKEGAFHEVEIVGFLKDFFIVEGAFHCNKYSIGAAIVCSLFTARRLREFLTHTVIPIYNAVDRFLFRTDLVSQTPGWVFVAFKARRK